MVVLALVGILAALALPSWNEIILTNATRSAVSEWTSSFQFARTEAVRQNTAVTLCPSSNGSTCTTGEFEVGWIVKTGTSATAVTDRILQDTLPQSKVTMAIVAPSKNFTILPNGLPVGNFLGGTITVAPADTNAPRRFDRTMCIAKTGRVRTFTREQLLAVAGCTTS
jgi:type IV fimbrial biogenesis protein FimT